MREYTHPDVLGVGVEDGWADPVTDPTEIDWAARDAVIPFEVVAGRPVNPCEPDHPIQRGRNEMGHWGEALAADAVVFFNTVWWRRWLLMVERRDGHGWALPGGHVDPGEGVLQAAARELEEETTLSVAADAMWVRGEPRYVPDPRGSREAWMVTVPCSVRLGVLDDTMSPRNLPVVAASSDAKRAAWVRADDYSVLQSHIEQIHKGVVFAAHVGMLAELLG